MNGNAEDEKILHARNLLKKFQSKQHHPQQQQQKEGHLAVNAGPGSSLNGSDASAATFSPSNSRNINHNMENSSSCNESICQEGTSQISRSRDSSRPPSSIGPTPGGNDLLTHNMESSGGFEQFRCHSVPKGFENQADSATLKNSLAQKQQELNAALSKLQSLHKHYAEIHSAYSQLLASQNQNNSASPPAYAEQIQQLRTALAVSMDDKTTLQSQSRELTAKMEALSQSQQQHQHNIIPSSSSPTSYELESRLNKVATERDHLLETVRNQSYQIEQQRKECSALEAKLVLIQQDRLDTQARLKSLYEEKTQMERNLEQMRQDLGMRDIYLRQLARHSGANELNQTGARENGSEGMEGIQETNKQLENDLEQCKREMVEMQKQTQASRENWQNSMYQTNAQIQQFEIELAQLRRAKNELESTNGYLEEQLRIIQQTNAQTITTTPNSTSNEIAQSTPFAPADLTKLQQEIMELTSERAKALTQANEAAKLAESKKEELDALRMSLTEAEAKIFQLEHQKSIQSTINTDAALLSVQLQNEKATVSRAVGQNMELKAQLAELQDRLITVINESAAKEDERVSALASVEKLKMELEEVKSSKEETGNDVKTMPIESTMPETKNEQNREDKNDNIIIGEVIRELCTIGTQTEQINERIDETAPMEATFSAEAEELREIHAEPIDVLPQQSHHLKSIEYDRNGQQHQQGEEQHHHELKEMSNKLENRLEQLSKENQQFRMDNQKLQHWLMVLETENESIGEYIALYRFQRGNIQKRMAEKDQQLHQLQEQNSAMLLQLMELHNSVMSFLGQSQQERPADVIQKSANPEKMDVLIETEQREQRLESISDEQTVDVDNDNSHGNGKQQHQLQSECDEQQEEEQENQHQQQPSDEMKRLIRALEKSLLFNVQAPQTAETADQCCSGRQEESTQQIQCTGCLECRGEMYTL